MVSMVPNYCLITAQVLQVDPAGDDFGAYAQLHLISVTEIPGWPNLANGQQGKEISAFVPPPLLDKVQSGATYSGKMTCRGSGYKYALVPT